MRFFLSLAGIVLFVACALALIVGAAAAFGGYSLAWPTKLGGWMFGALLLVLVLRFAVIRVEGRGREG